MDSSIANAVNTGTSSTTSGTVAATTAPFTATKPAPSAALYVGDLAPDVTEPMLYEIFNAVAPVTNIRVCRNNITRASLGYAYVNFSNNADALKAMDMLAYSSIKGRPCRIMLSQRDPSLRRSNVGNVFIKNLVPGFTTRELYDTFKEIGTILSCKVALDSKGVSKRYGFVHFDSEEAAKIALSINGADFGGLEVMQYIPRANRQTADKWTNIFAKNIPKHWTKKQLDELFAPFGKIVSSTINVDENGASKGFGFVCYETHDDAVKAVEALHGRDVESLPNPPSKEDSTIPGADGEAPRPIKFYAGKAQKRDERERDKREKAETAKRERAQKWQGCNLYVRNLDETIDDETLRKEFAVHGTIISAKVSRDPENRSKGFGFVCFSVPEEATKARELMHRKMLQGKPLYVTLWESKDSRAARMSQTAVRNMNGRGPNNLPGGVQLPGNMNPMANMNNNMNLMFMQPQMVANAVYASMATNPQLGNLVRSMNPNDLSNFINNIFVNNIANMMRMSQMPVQANRGPGGNANANNRNAVPNMGNFNPAAAFMGNALAGMDPSTLAAMNNQVRQQQGGNRQGQQPGAQRPVQAQATSPRMATVAQGKNTQARPQQAQQGRNAPNAVPANAPGMQFRANGQARNVPDGQTNDAASSQNTKENLVQQLANATPSDRKNIIGEKLYSLIYGKQPALAGKITGMLLDGIEDSELIHLLEAPVELDARIREAIQVLDEHKKNGQ